MLRQFFMQIPTELDEAARIDGAGDFASTGGSYPLSRAALATAAAFSFFGVWDGLLRPAHLHELDEDAHSKSASIFKNSYGGSNWPSR